MLDGPRWGPASGKPAQQLVVLCHGVGADGFDLIDLGPSWSRALPDAVFVSPHAPLVHDSGFGRQWFSLADRTPPVLEATVNRLRNPKLARPRVQVMRGEFSDNAY